MSRDPEPVVDLRDVIALDADAAGNLYAVQRQEDGQLGVIVLDGRQEVLEAQQRQGSLQEPARITSPAATQTVRAQPAIDFDVRGVQVAPSGRYLLLHGVSYQDSSIVVMAVMDMHGGQPIAAGRQARGGGATARLKSCRLHPVDPVLFGSRPGLVLYQASWHPHSEEHLAVLTSDNRLRLYRVTHSLAAAEQTLHVVLAAGAAPQRYGLGLGLGTPVPSPGPYGAGAAAAAGSSAATGGGEPPASSDVVAFAFGPDVGWGLFALLLLAADGLVYALGPVAPFGMRCAAALLERLGREEAAAAEWLETVFGADAVRSPSTKNRWPVLPHVVEGVSPAVVGPLNPRPRHELPLLAGASSLVVTHTLTAAPAGTAAGGGDSASVAPSSVSTAVVGSAEGRLLAYALAGPWAPAWCDAAPQYMSVTGTAAAAPSAVRYKCALRTAGTGTAAAAAGGSGMNGGAGAAVVTPRMHLLDVVELPPALPRRGGGGAAGGRGDAAAAASTSDVDEEDDDDGLDEDGYGVSASAVSAARRAMSLHVQAGGAGSAANLAGGGATATVWVRQRAGGCWRVTLPWSGMLVTWLGQAVAGPPSRGASGLRAGAAADALPAELPAPVVTCVYDAKAAMQGSATPAASATAAGGAAAVSSCLLQNPLLGGGLLVLTAAGVLHFFQPAGAASLLMEQQQQQAATSASPHAPQQRAAATGAPAGSPARPPGTSPEQRRAQVEAHIKSVYGNLIVPPPDRKLPAPPAGAPKPLTAASPEGLRYLTDCIAALRGKHAAFLHGAAVDLRGRADVLRGEAGKHAAAVTELSELAAGLEGRQEALEARLSRVKLLHDNLVERAGMLASLHWSLPRALSHAELAARDELAGAESRLGSLQGQWATIAARARRQCEQRRSSGAGVVGVRVANIPEAQLEKVQDTVMAHYRGLAAARSALATLERLVSEAVADQTAEQLDRGLGRSGLTDAAAGALALGKLGLGTPGQTVA